MKTYPPLHKLLRLGDDCRLTAPHAGLETGAFLTVSGAPYETAAGIAWVECEFGTALDQQWDEFPVDLLQPLCAGCTEDAALRSDAGALMCTHCAEDQPWQEGDQ